MTDSTGPAWIDNSQSCPTWTKKGKTAVSHQSANEMDASRAACVQDEIPVIDVGEQLYGHQKVEPTALAGQHKDVLQEHPGLT